MKVLALLLAAMAGGAESCPPPAPSGMVSRAAPFGGVIAPTEADAAAAVTGGMVAKEAARRFLGLEPPPFLIAAETPGTEIEPGACSFAFPWRFPEAGRRGPPSQVLPHEIGHALFIRFLAPVTGKEEYGGGAPDWLDEMAAIAFEDPNGVRVGRSEARRHAERGALIPLERLLSMPHPEWTARATSTGDPATPPVQGPRSTETPAFYATLRALLDFLVERTGDERILVRLAEQARSDAPLDRWLLTHVPGVAGKDLRRLDAQIAAFVLTSPAYSQTRSKGAPEKPS